MKVQALRLHPYAGVNHRKGSKYEIFKEKDLKLLVAIKAVQVVGDSVPDAAQIKIKSKGRSTVEKTKRNIYARKDMRAETPAAPETKVKAADEKKENKKGKPRAGESR